MSDVRPSASRSSEFLDRFHRALAGGEEGPTVLYSGGIDSSLVAHCLDHLGRRPRLVTIGTPGASDLAAARSGAETLSLPIRIVEIETASLRPASRPDGTPPPEAPIVDGPIRRALSLAWSAATPGSVYCGQGADELFGGYAHFADLGPGEAEARRSADLHRLRHAEWPWAYRTAISTGRWLRAPFLDWEVVDYALELTPEEWYRPGERKHWLRGVAREHGLPEVLATRPKRALQFGSGVAKAMRAPS